MMIGNWRDSEWALPSYEEGSVCLGFSRNPQARLDLPPLFNRRKILQCPTAILRAVLAALLVHCCPSISL